MWKQVEACNRNIQHHCNSEFWGFFPIVSTALVLNRGHVPGVTASCTVSKHVIEIKAENVGKLTAYRWHDTTWYANVSRVLRNWHVASSVYQMKSKLNISKTNKSKLQKKVECKKSKKEYGVREVSVMTGEKQLVVGRFCGRNEFWSWGERWMVKVGIMQ